MPVRRGPRMGRPQDPRDFDPRYVPLPLLLSELTPRSGPPSNSRLPPPGPPRDSGPARDSRDYGPPSRDFPPDRRDSSAADRGYARGPPPREDDRYGHPPAPFDAPRGRESDDRGRLSPPPGMDWYGPPMMRDGPPREYRGEMGYLDRGAFVRLRGGEQS